MKKILKRLITCFLVIALVAVGLTFNAFGVKDMLLQLFNNYRSVINNALLLYGQLCIIKKKICTRKECCYYGKVSKFICENRA